MVYLQGGGGDKDPLYKRAAEITENNGSKAGLKSLLL